MTRKTACNAFAGLLLLVLSGCAEPPPPAAGVDSASQIVAIATPGVEGAACVVQTGGMTYQVAAPGTVKLPRRPETLTVNCFKGEHLRGAAKVSASFAPRETGVRDGCLSCTWPSIVTVAMRLNDAMMDVPVLRQGP